jgi:3-hydroxyisobutyrate dehydrogenase
LDAGALIVDCATIGPNEARRIASTLESAGFGFVDAPVTGGDVGARNGTLTFMVGGSAENLEFIRPSLEVMGSKIVHAGPVGSGQSLKLVNQLLCGVNLLAVVEAFRSAEVMGMDRSLVVEACGGGAAGSWQLVNLGPKIIDQDYRPGFRAKDLSKDLRLLKEALAEADAQAEPPSLARALAAFEALVQGGKGQLGTQAVVTAHVC